MPDADGSEYAKWYDYVFCGLYVRQKTMNVICLTGGPGDPFWKGTRRFAAECIKLPLRGDPYEKKPPMVPEYAIKYPLRRYIRGAKPDRIAITASDTGYGSRYSSKAAVETVRTILKTVEMSAVVVPTRSVDIQLHMKRGERAALKALAAAAVIYDGGPEEWERFEKLTRDWTMGFTYSF
ncbi:hypothetical protein ACFLSJ_00750 [Verrucomicrobiota bacterium]